MKKPEKRPKCGVLTKQDFVNLLQTVWNPAARSIVGARPIDEGAVAFAEMLWQQLAHFEPAIIRRMMAAELTRPEHWPDIRNIEQRCFEQSPTAEAPLESLRGDRSGVAGFSFEVDDRTAFALHVCDSTGPIDAAWFDRAAELCENGHYLIPKHWRAQAAALYRRWAERMREQGARKEKDDDSQT